MGSLCVAPVAHVGLEDVERGVGRVEASGLLETKNINKKPTVNIQQLNKTTIARTHKHENTTLEARGLLVAGAREFATY